MEESQMKHSITITSNSYTEFMKHISDMYNKGAFNNFSFDKIKIVKEGCERILIGSLIMEYDAGHSNSEYYITTDNKGNFYIYNKKDMTHVSNFNANGDTHHVSSNTGITKYKQHGGRIPRNTNTNDRYNKILEYVANRVEGVSRLKCVRDLVAQTDGHMKYSTTLQDIKRLIKNGVLKRNISDMLFMDNGLNEFTEDQKESYHKLDTPGTAIAIINALLQNNNKWMISDDIRIKVCLKGPIDNILEHMSKLGLIEKCVKHGVTYYRLNIYKKSNK